MSQKIRRKTISLGLTIVVFTLTFVLFVIYQHRIENNDKIAEVETTVSSYTQETTTEIIITTTTEKITTTTEPTTVKITTAAPTTKKVTTTEYVEIEEPLANIDYDYDDVEMLAAAMCQEAGGESSYTRRLCGNVIINRVNSPNYPNTIHGVISQPGQYAFYPSCGHEFPYWASESLKEACRAEARDLLNGNLIAPAGVVYQAEFIQGEVYEYSEGTYFCYE